MKYDISEIENEGFEEGFWTGTKKLFLFILITIIIAIGAIILVIYLSNQTTELKGAMSIDNLMGHLKSLQEIANANGNTRTTGTLGYNLSVEYVINQLAHTDHIVTTQVFSIRNYVQLDIPQFHFLDPFNISYRYNVDFGAFSFSGNGNITKTLYNVANRGCNEEDWEGFPEDNIALVRRGQCTFNDKLNWGDKYNASGMIIYNSGENGDTGLFSGTLGIQDYAPFPILFTTYSLGSSFADLNDSEVSIYVNGTINEVFTSNVIAETKNGNPGNVIVIGSHLDSVPAGPGINDNGSGSSLNLELAIQADKYLKNPKQKIRFIWFGAEELGLLGSHFYVNNLKANAPEDLPKIVCNLNFDMVGSPNFQRGIYNGTEAKQSILKASIEIQNLFEDFFAIKNLTSIPVPFTGRSDYGPFIDVDIPAGGLFTGAEVIKDDASRKLFGGLGNTAFDPCYHKACDTIDNINQSVFIQNAEAAAYVVQILASNKDIHKLLNIGEAERLSSQMREWKEIKDRKYIHSKMD